MYIHMRGVWAVTKSARIQEQNCSSSRTTAGAVFQVFACLPVIAVYVCVCGLAHS